MKKFFSLAMPAVIGFANVVHLTPPVFNQNTIVSEIACNRPMRIGKFNISTGIVGDKTIVNCLGHGGSGWTTLFGSVHRAIQLFEETNPSKETPIRVLGTGCMGLLSAIELHRLGYNVRGITTKELYDIPSWRATGYFALVSVKTSTEEQENLNRIGLITFQTYQLIESGKHPYLTPDIVRMIPVYCSSDTDSGVDDLEAKGLLPAQEKVTIDFGNGVQYPNFVKHTTYFMDVTKIMKQLSKEVERIGIPVEMKEVQSFDEVEEQVVFNCTGLGGRVLNQDPALVPVRGHLIMLADSAGTEHMNYMIYTKDPHFKGKYIYMFPKPMTVTSKDLEGYSSQGLLGGTFVQLPEEITEEEVAQIDKENFEDLRNRNALFFTGKPFN